MFLQKLEAQEANRIAKLQRKPAVPASYSKAFSRAEERRERAGSIERMKMENLQKAEEVVPLGIQLYGPYGTGT